MVKVIIVVNGNDFLSKRNNNMLHSKFSEPSFSFFPESLLNASRSLEILHPISIWSLLSLGIRYCQILVIS